MPGIENTGAGTHNETIGPALMILDLRGHQCKESFILPPLGSSPNCGKQFADAVMFSGTDIPGDVGGATPPPPPYF